MVVPLAREHAAIGVISVRWDGRVGNHECFQVKPNGKQVTKRGARHLINVTCNLERLGQGLIVTQL
jgi:hypothetical protein